VEELKPAGARLPGRYSSNHHDPDYRAEDLTPETQADGVTFGQLFGPQSLAIIGASENPTKFAGKVTANAVRSAEHTGRDIYLVNPHRETVLGRATYATITDIPGSVDHAYIAVPADLIVSQLQTADQAGIRLATIFSGGFLESGAREAHAALASALKLLRIRVIGPNCNGLINVYDNLAVTSSSVPYLKLFPGPIAVISHSGALGQVNGLQRACSRGIGIGYQMSCGNAIDISEVELIEQAFADPRITVVVAILERITAGARLLKTVREARAAGKQLIMVKLGQSAAGRSAILGHTGESLGNDGLARRLLDEVGVILVEDIDCALECADLWAKNPGIRGNRVASVSLSGGNLAYFVDSCAVRDISHPELAVEHRDSLRGLLPPMAVVSNPVDLSSAADVAVGHTRVTSVLPGVLSVLDKSGQDALVAILTLPPESDLCALMTLDRDNFATPVIVIWAGDSREGKTKAADMRQAGLTVFENAVSCARALQQMQISAAERPATTFTADRAWPLEQARQRLLEAGLRFPAGKVVGTEDEASAQAGRLGYPVAVKSAAVGLVHKAAAGGVLLDICGEGEVRHAYRNVVEAASRLELKDPHRVLVERMTGGEHALIVSVTCDDSFGPVLALGESGAIAADARSLSIAALDLMDSGELDQFVRDAAGDAAAAASWSLQEAIRAIRTVAESEHADLVEINPLFIRGSVACAVDCVMIRRARHE
jgi:acetyltransferase